MTERITTRRPCIRCGAERAPARRRYCDPCAELVRSQPGPCEVEGCAKQRRYRKRHCPTHEGRMAAHGVTEIPVRISPCLGCGNPIQRRSVTGKDPLRCPPCQRAHRNEYKVNKRAAERAERLAKPLTCETCGVEFYVTSAASWGRRWCDPCTKAHGRQLVVDWIVANPDRYREMARRHQHNRRARKFATESEKFEDIEIFARDGWRCKIEGCGKRINMKLKWPHPMSPSLDHILPLVEGGAHTRANARAAHLICNIRRAHRGGNEQLALIG